MYGLLVITMVAMTGTGASGPEACGEGARCTEAWRTHVGGIEVRVVESRTADVHAADQEASVSIYVRGTAGWFETHAWWSSRDIEMSTSRSTIITHRRGRIGALADGRPVVLLQIDLRDDGRDRAPPRRWPPEHRALVVACLVDRAAPSCTGAIWLRCGARCDEVRLRRGVLIWRDRDGRHREPLAAPLAS